LECLVLPKSLPDLAEAGALDGEAPVKRSGREVKGRSNFCESRRFLQGFAQVLADSQRHLAVAAVKHRDLAGRSLEECGELGFGAAHGQAEELRVEPRHERSRSES